MLKLTIHVKCVLCFKISPPPHVAMLIQFMVDSVDKIVHQGIFKIKV